VDELLISVKNSPTAPGYEEILIPGEPERRIREKKLSGGIYIEEKTWDEIQMLAGELNLKGSMPPL